MQKVTKISYIIILMIISVLFCREFFGKEDAIVLSLFNILILMFSYTCEWKFFNGLMTLIGVAIFLMFPFIIIAIIYGLLWLLNYIL